MPLVRWCCAPERVLLSKRFTRTLNQQLNIKTLTIHNCHNLMKNCQLHDSETTNQIYAQKTKSSSKCLSIFPMNAIMNNCSDSLLGVKTSLDAGVLGHALYWLHSDASLKAYIAYIQAKLPTQIMLNQRQTTRRRDAVRLAFQLKTSNYIIVYKVDYKETGSDTKNRLKLF